jgi:hypothetical protein
MRDVKLSLLAKSMTGRGVLALGPPSGFTLPAPRFREDIKALLTLAKREQPARHCIRSSWAHQAFYGFGATLLSGFGSTVEQPDAVHGLFGLWGSNKEGASSNYRELRKLVKTVKEEAAVGYLAHGELWVFTNNSTAESCLF